MPMPHLRRSRSAALVLAGCALAVVVSGCATPPAYEVPPARAATVPASTAPQSRPESSLDGTAAGAGKSGTVVQLSPPPRAPLPATRADWSSRFPNDDAVTVSANGMPLRQFIQYVFAEVLKVGYVVAEGIPGLDAPVTLNVQQPVSSRALYKLVAEVLESSKVGITVRDGVFFLHPLDGRAKGNIPIGFGRRTQDVPDVPGRVLQVIPLRYGVNVSIERTARGLVDVDIQPDATQSALFVTGEREAVLRVIDVVNLLDQPATRARQVAMVSLNYIGSRELTDQLVTLLENEGIPTGVGRAEGKNVALVPLEQLGAIAVFTSSADLLQRVEYWVRQIDKPSQGPEERYFIYHPRNARASDLADSLAPLIGADSLRQGNQARDTRSAMRAQGAGADGESASRTVLPGGITQDNALRRDGGATVRQETPMSVRGEGLTMSVDPRSNTLIFYTKGSRYQALLPMIRRLDVPPKQILLEATIAEVTLTGEFAYGVEFAFTEGKWSGGTRGNLQLPAGGMGLNWVGSFTDSVRAKLSASDSRVNILSNPTLVVRDGVEASILVGNDVPTVGATASDPIQSDRVITTVLYRRTGLDLQIRPTINAAGLIVLEISQSISNTVEGGSDVSGAPIFFERAVTTEVVARSGQSILLAGLVSENRSENAAKVPGLADVPLLGKLFESRSKSREKTELVLLITPRVIEDPSEWSAIRNGLQDGLENLVLPPEKPAAVPPAPASPPADQGTPPESGAPAGTESVTSLTDAPNQGGSGGR
jgi:general secretion pathway protein D